MRLQRILTSWGIVTILFLTGCMKQTVMYHSYQHVHDNWDKNDTVMLNVWVPDTAQTFRTSLLVRYLDSYPYQNLILSLDYSGPDSLKWESKTICIDLTEKSKWELSEWRGIRQALFPLEEMYFPLPANVQFKITHRMGNEPLTGINDIGIMVER